MPGQKNIDNPQNTCLTGLLLKQGCYGQDKTCSYVERIAFLLAAFLSKDDARLPQGGVAVMDFQT